MKKPATVCFLTGTLNAFAGAERITAVIANAFAERGHRVFVLALWDRASVFPLHPAVEHHALFDRRPSFKRAYFSVVMGIRRFVKRFDIDVLVEVDTMLTLFTLPATLWTHVRRIAWEHCHFDEDLGRKARRVARQLAGRTGHAVVVLTDRDRERWQSAMTPRAQIVTIANPLPFAWPDTPARRDTNQVLAVGRLTSAKGFDVLLDAWARVAPRHPTWNLLIVGEGDTRASLEGQVRQLQLEHAVQLPGTQTGIERIYQDSSVFCLSSRYEGFGLALVEAMAFGLGIVSTDCETGPRTLIQDGHNGLMVPVDDVQAIADALDLLISNPALRTTLGDRARMSAKRADIDHAYANWLRLLDGI